MLCAHCKKNEATVFCDCLKVLKTTTTIRSVQNQKEELMCGEQIGLCDKCLRTLSRKAGSTSFSWKILKIFALIVALGMILSLAGIWNSENGGGSRPLMIIGIVMFLGGSLIYLAFHYLYMPYVYTPKCPFYVFAAVGWDPDSTKPNRAEDHYIPVGGGYYESVKEFRLVNIGLSTEFKEKIYNKYIITEEWKNVLQDGVAPDTAGTENPGSLVDDCVRRLLDLYDRHPQGFLVSEAGDVRKIGMELDEAGGMNLMLEAHRQFAARKRLMARNLEMVWDGIGSWRG